MMFVEDCRQQVVRTGTLPDKLSQKLQTMHEKPPNKLKELMQKAYAPQIKMFNGIQSIAFLACP